MHLIIRGAIGALLGAVVLGPVGAAVALVPVFSQRRKLVASKNVVYLLIGGAAALFVLGTLTARRKEINDVLIDPALGKHRGLGAVYGGEPDQIPLRAPSFQDKKPSADYVGYPYSGTQPGTYAKGEPAQMTGKWWDKGEDRWTEVPLSPLDYQRPPMRIPKLFKDSNRYWDGITSRSGVEAQGHRVHLFHLRPSYPTRGIRSISGSLAEVGGGFSTASTMRVPAV